MANPNPITLTQDDMQTLADRLYSRGVSKLSADTTEQATDLRVASRVIRRLLHELDAAASVAGDLSRALRVPSVSVEG
jgi:hypothetical protein